jgi:solute carrier family 25 oxoglutarate transporter 11
MMGLASSLVKTEGFFALYYGLSASLLRQVAFVGTKFGSYDALKAVSVSGQDTKELNFSQKTLCGFAAGAIGATVGNPADLALVRMQGDGLLPVTQRRNYRNVTHALSRIVREEGVMTLWRGSFPTIQRAMLVTASQLAVYDQAKVPSHHNHAPRSQRTVLPVFPLLLLLFDRLLLNRFFHICLVNIG